MRAAGTATACAVCHTRGPSARAFFVCCERGVARVWPRSAAPAVHLCPQQVGFYADRSQAMEEVLHDIAHVVQSIASVEADVIAVETAIQEAKAAGDTEELAALRDKVNKLRDKENKLRDKENKLRDEKNKLLDKEITLLRLQGTRAAGFGRRVASCACVSPHAPRTRPRAALRHACRLQSAAGERRLVA
jgi:hypothetical protein